MLKGKNDNNETKINISMLVLGAWFVLSGALVVVSTYFAYRTLLPRGKITSIFFTATGWKWCKVSLVVDVFALAIFGGLLDTAIEVSNGDS